MDTNTWDMKNVEMETDDFSFALRLQEQFDCEISESSMKSNTFTRIETSLSLIDPHWEFTDPNPDIRSLFVQFDERFFGGRLSGIEVKWSPRMTLCAGLCCYEGRGGLCSVRLSQPLLRLRPRKDLVETLLHEMIHAYLFVTENDKDHDGHGPEFHKHMYRINKESGTKITVYHTFHDEVENYRQHWWRCDGPCRQRQPYFGYVKRSMNRAPSSRDPWWGEHKRSCGGTYVKVKEPEGYGQKKKKGESSAKTAAKKTNDDTDRNRSDIRSFLSTGSIKTKTSGKTQHGGKIIKNPKPKIINIDSDNDSTQSQDDWFSEDFDLKPSSSKPESSNTSNRWFPKPQSGKINVQTIWDKSHATENGIKPNKNSTGAPGGNVKIQTIWDQMDTSDEPCSSSGGTGDLHQLNSDSSRQSTSGYFSHAGNTLGSNSGGKSFLAIERKKLNVSSHSSLGSFALNNNEKETSKRKTDLKNLLISLQSDSEDDSSEIKPLRKRLKISSLTKNVADKSSIHAQDFKQNKENEDKYCSSNNDIRRMISPSSKASSSTVGHPCPVCKTYILDSLINSHLDECLSWQ